MGLFQKNILPYHHPPAPYTRELFGVEYLLKQSGGEPLPLLNEADEAERDDQTAEAQFDDDEGMDVSAVPSLESLATFAGEEDNDNLCKQEVEICAVVRANISGDNSCSPPTQTHEPSTGDDPSADLVPSAEDIPSQEHCRTVWCSGQV